MPPMKSIVYLADMKNGKRMPIVYINILFAQSPELLSVEKISAIICSVIT